MYTPSPRAKRPYGQPTRGKTALNRLRQVDAYIALTQAYALTDGTPLIVDVGYGAQAWTALEMRERWLSINPRIRLLGIEIDPMRVEAAQPHTIPGVIDFRLGGFNVLDATGGEQARVIRAYNVLRQYDEGAVGDALASMTAALQMGGLLIEGTSTPSGRIVAFDLYLRETDGLAHVALVFGTNFRDTAAPDPVQFQAILPKRLIHHAHDTAPARFFAAWERALQLAKGAGKTGARQRWRAAAHLLHESFGYRVDVRERVIRRGFLALYDSLQ